MMALLRFIKSTFSFDYRSLALYRVLIGLIIMADVLYRVCDLRDFYTDAGLIPRTLFLTEMAQKWSFSLHLANGTLGFAAFMFLIQFIFGVMVLVGFKTRWAILFSFILNVSVHNRNWLINNGGDDILRAILLLSAFLPLNKAFSFDSALEEKGGPEKKAHFSTWGLSFFLQVFVIYFLSYLFKNHPIWREEYTGVFFASQLDIFATPLGFWLREFPEVQKLATIFTIYLEQWGPLLLVFAFLTGPLWWIVRTGTVILFWFLHAGIILTMWIGVFPYTCLAMWSIFLPGPLWDRILMALRARFSTVTIYYDDECNMCKKTVLIFREFFLLPETKILRAQEVPEILEVMKNHNSWVVVNQEGEKFFQYEAFLEIVKHSPLLKIFQPLFAVKPMNYIGLHVYKWVSSHRQQVSKITQYWALTSPKKEVLSLSILYQAAGAFIFSVIFMWNISSVKTLGIRKMFFVNAARYLHLYQEWNMFAPFPKLENIWLEVTGTLGDGSQIEIITADRDVYSVKAEAFYKSVKNEHWRKLYLNVSENIEYQRYFAGFMCRKWNENWEGLVKSTYLKQVDVVAFAQSNHIDGSRGGVNRRISWTHWCFDKDYKAAMENKNSLTPSLEPSESKP